MGSSPRVWGQAIWALYLADQAGIIPTRVGTSNVLICHQKIHGDHPHACGDKSSRRYVCLCELGSSPRVWGQALHFCAYQNHFRIIPTRVGTSGVIRQAHHELKDHPHACGDKPDLAASADCVLGSSPRVWGQALRPPAACSPAWIIPTRVGTSLDHQSGDFISMDHPHACGDKKEISHLLVGVAGSSPRVWGQVATSHIVMYMVRIIPTRVGTRRKKRN